MKHLLDQNGLQEAIQGLAERICAHEPDMSKVALVGIHTRGVPLAERLAACLKERGHSVLQGMLDINLYRDDLSEIADQPVLKETRIEFDLSGKVIYLVDDVLYTGRTIRAAMDALFDLGRPQAIHLVVFAKRDGRELPIDTDLFALDVFTEPLDNIKVKFTETDGSDEVLVLQQGDG